ncbi:hypothetical protein KJ853_01545 [Patescibacteria group bacterium]|nr:hypothetical protein [Patescibacteria group bacterium]
MKLCFYQNFHNKNQSPGFGLVEILIAVSFIGLALAGLITLTNLTFKLSQQAKNNLIAANLATEALEAVRAIKEESWSTISSLTIGNPYHPQKAGLPLKWSLAAGNENLNGFMRQVVINNVYRDGQFNIVSSGGTLDPDTKKITSSVFWSYKGQSYNATLFVYLTRWQP